MRLTRSLCLLLLALTLAVPAFAVPGAADRVPAATLLVPFFETGINSTTHPHDTLLVVTNWLFADTIFHYHVWDVDGNATGLNGNITLNQLDTWSAAMRDLIGTASPAVRTQLTQGAFYRGFVTIDVVTAGTALNPLQADYPFGTSNALEGFIYYTRLSQGSANGLAMVPIENVAATTNSFMRGFYSSTDNREEIDSTARFCANQLGTDPAGTTTCSTASDDSDIDRFHLRIFRSAPLTGSSRAVIFTWRPSLAGGPSVYCDSQPCESVYTYRQYNESGDIVVNGGIRLDHAVNIIEDASIVGTQSGWLSIFDVPNIEIDSHVYAFTFNSAAPAGNPNLTWDAIFEGYIIP
ncbi:MAG TPA: hypothetical protein VNM67_16365 [Thermoanaerobaculia bacterium]|jgi:hypothetical protein|nr:hypothetical protein [Thermoanaerobaculia bacterium]